MRNALKIVLVLTAPFLSNVAYGQCKGFTKNKCLPVLSPYVSNGQMNSAQLYPGENAELELNLNKGLSYRLLICTDPSLSNSTYQIATQNDFVLTSDTMERVVTYKDIQVDRSQTLTLSLQTPEIKNTTGIEQSGCVTILLGFK